MSAPGVEKRTTVYENIRLALPEQLPAYLQRQRWFGGKARQIHLVHLVDLVPLQTGRVEALLLLVRVEYQIGRDEMYVLPVVFADKPAGQSDESAIFKLDDGAGNAFILLDALKDEQFLSWLLDAIEVKLVSKGLDGEIRAAHNDVFQEVRSNSGGDLRPRLLSGEQSNNSIAYGERLILKLFRRVEQGLNPDLEIGSFLTEKAHFPNVPAVAGFIEYRSETGILFSLGILQAFVPNQGDAWRFTLESLEKFWSEVTQHSGPSPAAPHGDFNSLLDGADTALLRREMVGSYPEKAELLGKRTAELHLALASDSSDPAFAPEPYTPSVQKEFENSARELTSRNIELLREKLNELPQESRMQAMNIIERENDILAKFVGPSGMERLGLRVRIHGDYHLGQILYTGTDFMIIDFEGEPARPLSERRKKRSPLQDVAGMLRSFHYAAFAPLLGPGNTSLPAKNMNQLAPWAESWYACVAHHFLQSYFKVAESASFLPLSRGEISALLQIHLLEKAIYELGYELNNRPTWVGIPLAGISQLLIQ